MEYDGDSGGGGGGDDDDDGDGDDDDEDPSLRYIFQSIQHLRAAVGLTDAAVAPEREEGADGDDHHHHHDDEYHDDDDDEESIDAIRYAAVHNLGLAYIALDGKGPSSDGRTRTTHFLDWAKSSPAAAASKSSWALASNVGAMMLQMGMVEDAASSLGYIATEFCDDDVDSLVSSFSRRHEEVCSIVRRNLAVARAALDGGEEEDGRSAHAREDDVTAVVDEVSQSNGDASSSSTSVNVLIPTEEDGDVSETANEASEVASSDDKGQTEANNFVSDESTSSGIQRTDKDEAIDPILTQWGLRSDEPSTTDSSTVKPEMRNALAALEKAATEGTQRTRIFLALARARSSAGDLSGAVDASLKAIGAATSGEEIESSTSYLENLMEKMAGEKGQEKMHLVVHEDAPETSEELSANRDLSLLEMKLELERLKYKVLEQEMRLGCQACLGCQQHSPNPVDDVIRVIGYQKQECTIANDAPRRVISETKQNSVTGQIVTKVVDHVQNAIQEVPTVAADEIQTASPIVADDREPVVPESSTSDSAANVTLTEYQDPDAQLSTETDAAADAESNAQADAQPLTISDGEVDAESNSDDDAQPSTETDVKLHSEADAESKEEFVVDLPDLFSPELKSPAAIP